jgi:hypothetical protein
VPALVPLYTPASGAAEGSALGSSKRGHTRIYDILQNITCSITEECMQLIEVELLSNITNAPIIRMPTRHYPGILIQGDSLHILYSLVETLSKQLASKVELKETDDANEEIQYTVMELQSLLSVYVKMYEKALTEHNITPPYTP